MQVRAYLPSNQFSTIVGSIGLAGLLILAAQYATSPHTTPPTVASVADTTQNDDWQAQLDAIQAQAPGLPEAPSQDSVNQLLDASKDDNLTSSVARSLIVKIGNANSQGLGQDILTQDQLVAQAASMATSQPDTVVYTLEDLTQIAQSGISLRAYGNAVMKVMTSHPQASVQDTYKYLGEAVDSLDERKTAQLGGIGNAYMALAEDLAAIPTPATLAPLHLKVVNDLAAAAKAFPDMQKIISDPLKAMAAFQTFQTNQDEAARVLTSIAQQLSKSGILFTKDEPGSAWSVFLSS